VTRTGRDAGASEECTPNPGRAVLRLRNVHDLR
jgi:hypothetical protein